jgi:hypothetical protein
MFHTYSAYPNFAAGAIALLAGAVAMYFYSQIRNVFPFDQQVRGNAIHRYQQQLTRWRTARQRRENMFYCYRCDVVFIPGQGDCAPVDQFADYLLQQTKSP